MAAMANWELGLTSSDGVFKKTCGLKRSNSGRIKGVGDELNIIIII